MSRTIQQLAQEALDVQNASNLCGVAQSFARAMVDLRAHNPDSMWLRTHPITFLWCDKIESLAGKSTIMSIAAYDDCERLAGLTGGDT